MSNLLINEACRKFTDKNVFELDFFVLLIPDKSVSKSILKMKQQFSKIVSVPVEKTYSAHLTLLWGIKFDALVDLRNYLRHIYRILKEQSKIEFSNYFVSQLDERIVLDFNDVDALFDFRSKLLRKSYLFSDVLSQSFLQFNYNRNKDENSEWYFHPHITILDINNYKSPFFYYNKDLALKEALASSKRLSKSELKRLSFSRISVVYSDNKDSKWKELISFDIQ